MRRWGIGLGIVARRWLAGGRLIVVVVIVIFTGVAEVVVVLRAVAGAFGFFDFVEILFDDPRLDLFAALGIDWVGDIGVQLRSLVRTPFDVRLFQLDTALIAVRGTQMVLAAATGAVPCQFATGHRDERTVGAFDNLQVAYHEGIVEGDGAESSQPIAGIFHQLDADFGDLHGCILPGR